MLFFSSFFLFFFLSRLELTESKYLCKPKSFFYEGLFFLFFSLLYFRPDFTPF